MAAVNVTFPGNLAQVDSAQDLRAIPSSFIADGDLYLVNGLQGLFEYDPGSTAVDDGKDVIRPYDKTPLQAGRWIRNVDGLASGPVGPAGGDANSYATLSAMKSAGITGLTYNLASPSGADGGVSNGLFTYQLGNFTGRTDVVQVNGIPLSTGALVRQSANSIAFKVSDTLPSRDSASKIKSIAVDLDDFLMPGETDYAAASSRANTYCYQTGATLRLVGGKNYQNADIQMFGTWRFECNGAKIRSWGAGQKYIAGGPGTPSTGFPDGYGSQMLPTPWVPDSGDPDYAFGSPTLIAIQPCSAGAFQIVLNVTPASNEFVEGQWIRLNGPPTSVSSFAAGKPNYIDLDGEYVQVRSRSGTLVTLKTPLKYNYSSVGQITAGYSKALAVNCEATGVVTTTVDSAYNFEIRSSVNMRATINCDGSAAAGAMTYSEGYDLSIFANRAYGPMSTARGTGNGRIRLIQKRRNVNDGTPDVQSEGFFIEECLQGSLILDGVQCLTGSLSVRSLAMAGGQGVRELHLVNGCTFDGSYGSTSGSATLTPGFALSMGEATGLKIFSSGTTWIGAAVVFPDTQYPYLSGRSGMMCRSLGAADDVIIHRGDTFKCVGSFGAIFLKGSNYSGRVYHDESCQYINCSPATSSTPDDVYSWYEPWQNISPTFLVSPYGVVTSPFTNAQYRRGGRFTFVKGVISFGGAAANTAAVSLPVGRRPSSESARLVPAFTTADTTYPSGQTSVRWQANGNISIGNTAGMTAAFLELRIPIDA